MIETYICASCGGEFGRMENEEWNTEKALKETKENFGIELKEEESDIICDDCYNTLMLQLNN